MTDPAGAIAAPLATDPAVLRGLRRDRRTRRMASIEWFEAAYRVYLVGFLAVVAVLGLSSALGDEPVTASQAGLGP